MQEQWKVELLNPTAVSTKSDSKRNFDKRKIGPKINEAALLSKVKIRMLDLSATDVRKKSHSEI